MISSDAQFQKKAAAVDLSPAEALRREYKPLGDSRSADRRMFGSGLMSLAVALMSYLFIHYEARDYCPLVAGCRNTLAPA